MARPEAEHVRSPTQGRAAWAGMALLLCAPALVHGLLSTAGREVWFAVVVLLPVTCISVARRRWHLPNPGWRPLQAATGVQGIGMVAGLTPVGETGRDLLIVAATVVSMPLFVRAFRELGGQRETTRAAVLLDAAIVTLAAGSVFWALVLGPADYLGRKTVLSTAVDICAMALVGVVITLILQFLLNHRDLPAYVTVLAAAGLAGTVFPLVHWSLEMGADLAQGPAGAPVLALAYGLIAASPLHPSARQPVVARREEVDGRPGLMPARLILVAGSLLVPVGLRLACLAEPAGMDCGAGTVALEGLLLIAVWLRVVSAVGATQAQRRRLRQREHLHTTLARHAADGVGLLDPDGRVLYATPMARTLYGLSEDGGEPADLVHPAEVDMVRDTFRQAARQPGTPVVITARPARRPDRWVETRLTDLRHDPVIGAFVANVRDVTAEREHAFALQRLAYEDALTGLRNRAALLRHVTHRLDAGDHVTALFCDLDRLKLVNDTLGHAAGDRLMVEAADRFRDVVGDDGVVGRLGGDEFLVVLSDTDTDSAMALAERLRADLARPFPIKGRSLRLSCSIGLVAGAAPATAEGLVAEADLAMYRAKELGRDRVVVFDTMLRAEQERRHRTQVELPDAIARGELVLEYQPIVGCADGLPWGAEALVRWTHPREGTLPPAAFIDVAEDTGLIVPLGAAVLQEALRAAADHPDVGVLSVNIAHAQLEEADFADALVALLEAQDVDPHRVLLELTERTLLTGSTATVARLRALRELGVRIALDDFGTGYASFGALRTLPLDILKVDQTLLPEPRGHGTILEAVTTMAHSLHLQVIVEGVERPDQLAMAVELGADLVQGYLIGTPGDVTALPSRDAGQGRGVRGRGLQGQA